MGLKCQVVPVSSYPLKNLSSMFQMTGVLHMVLLEVGVVFG